MALPGGEWMYDQWHWNNGDQFRSASLSWNSLLNANLASKGKPPAFYGNEQALADGLADTGDGLGGFLKSAVAVVAGVVAGGLCAAAGEAMPGGLATPVVGGACTMVGGAVTRFTEGLLNGDSIDDATMAATDPTGLLIDGTLGYGLGRISNLIKPATNTIDDVIGAACRSNSFIPSTRVLMADGTTKPIEDVEIGDMVLASDPDSGDRGPRRVIDTIVGDGIKQLVNIEIDGAVVTATDRHPFWVDDDGEWVDAGELEIGDELLASDGTVVVVEGVGEWAAVRRVHNLTVEGIHTYFVVVGAQEVLVHNCIRNGRLAGQTHPTTGVPFDDAGFPDFSAWRHPDVADVRIQLSGSRSTDFARADAAAGITGQRPAGYTWHHHQDTGLMQLVDSRVHAQTGHTGGFSGAG
jgi:hypothetical protein